MHLVLLLRDRFQTNPYCRKEKAVRKRSYLFALVPVLLYAGVAGAQYPMVEMIADQVIQKYQQSSCEQLWQQKAAPKTSLEQTLIQSLRENPQMRIAFINKVAAPLVNKMFECGMIP